MRLDWPLMQDNITTRDKEVLAGFLMTGKYPPSGQPGVPAVPRLTHGAQVRAFEEEFAQWLGVKHAVMVNSGASANLITMQALKILHGPGRVMVPCITWVSDIAAVLHAGLEPVFCDVDPYTLGMNWAGLAEAQPLAVFPTHCLGFSAFGLTLPAYTRGNQYVQPLIIEDCCEAIGATFGSMLAYGDNKLGTAGLMSNFSFYYAHHISTIEGGMVCTDDERCYELLRMLRSHGLGREMDSANYRSTLTASCPDLDPEFIFTHPAYNVRPTELNAVLGRTQLPRLDYQNAKRTENLVEFLNGLDGAKYRTKYRLEGSSNYALPLILQNPDDGQFQKVTETLRELGVEFRKGTAGGGNQLRQPYAKARFGPEYHKRFPEAEHIHLYGLYIGNFPSLEKAKINALCEVLNTL